MTTAPHIFNRRRVRMHRDRAQEDFPGHDFLFTDVAERICDRLSDINRSFPLALDLGAHNGLFAKIKGERGGIKTLIQTDLSKRLISDAQGYRLVADEEALPFAEGIFDLVVSCGSLHWVNDLPGSLIQIQRILKPDGLFIAIMPGGETLKELRQSFEQAELASKGGISPRVSPFIDVRDAGNLLQRAGFSLPVIDSDVLTVEYEHPLKLLTDLKEMGETNALVESSKHFTPTSLLMLAMDHYLRHFSNAEGRIVASFEFVTLTGWKPHTSQQQPSKRGSGKINLGDVLQ